MKYHYLLLALLLAGCASTGTTPVASNDRQMAAVQDETIPYKHFRTQLKVTPGRTYLAFMKNEAKPAFDEYDEEIQAVKKKFPHQYSRWQKELIEGGDGVAVRIDKDNYFFNVGYGTGEEEDDIKSGRSYGVGPTGRQSDPSDLQYLGELQDYLKGEPKQTRDFYEALLSMLTNSDPAGWASLSDDGQVVATDFLAIYTAESDRHLMVDLNVRKHPWEIDLAAATFATAFVAKTGKVPSDGSLVNGSARDWWAKGATGSGIGNTRNDRKALTRAITKAAAESADGAKAIKQVVSIVGEEANNDLIQAVFEYLNAPRGAPLKMSAGDRKKLVDGVLDFMEVVRSFRASDIQL